MAGYIIEHEGKQYSPDGRCEVSDAQKHNTELTQGLLAAWAKCPDRWAVYIFKGHDGALAATTWTGELLSVGRIEQRSFQTNMSRNMVAIRFRGTNGATYYGRYGADWSQLCRVRKAK